MIYNVRKQSDGLYYVLDADGERAARVGRFHPGPMVSVSGQGLYSPPLAKAVARAMTRLANDLEREAR